MDFISLIDNIRNNKNMGMFGGFVPYKPSELDLDFCALLRRLPLYYDIEVSGQRYIVTHSWLVYSNGDTCININYDNSRVFHVSDIDSCDSDCSIWDRAYSTKFTPVGLHVIHGHTIVSSKSKYGSVLSPINNICKIGDNINVDCGCFIGAYGGGNLAAYRIEDGKEFYVNDIDHMYDSCIEMTDRINSLHNEDFEPWMLYLCCNRLKNGILMHKDLKYVDLIYKGFMDRYGLDCSINPKNSDDNMECILQYSRLRSRLLRYSTDKYPLYL